VNPARVASAMPYWRSLAVLRARVAGALLRGLCAGAAAAALAGAARAGALRVEAPYCFTDGRAVVKCAPEVEAVRGRVRVLTDSLRGPEVALDMRCAGGRLELAPLCEGIHVVAIEEPFRAEVRFLAIAPPRPVSPDAVRRALPRSGRRLLAGEPYTILAMGDSVMNTGDCEGMLAMMLARATGNGSIRVVERSYPGRSADAAARFFEDDAVPTRPDLGLLMYGLNDQACFVSLETYLEHYEYVARRLRDDLGADCVFMQPTPNPEPGRPPEQAIRTIIFAESLAPLAERLGVPLARTFHAVWGRGGPTLQDAARATWPRYPPSYDRQFESLVETGSSGDATHPNALGHLAIARAVLDAISAPAPEQSGPAALEFRGRTLWTDAGVETRLEAVNVSTSRRRGRLEAYPPPEDRLEGSTRVEYDLEPGGSVEMVLRWPNARRPEDLLRHPADKYLAGPMAPRVPLVEFSDGGCRVHAPEAPFEPFAWFVRERGTAGRRGARVSLVWEGGRRSRTVRIPGGSPVGRIDLVEKVGAPDRPGWAVAQLAYVRYGSALRGEAELDGLLSEWTSHVWSPVGEECQARFARGPEDNRGSTSECYLRWAFKAGRECFYAAASARGELSRDSFTIFFDPRGPARLGTVGRYYWVSGSLRPDGTLGLARGETSREDKGLAGRWARNGDETAIELRVPYALFEATSWPASGDLGISIWWIHVSPDGRRTNLMWSEDGHPWSPRWYGVVRLQERPDESRLPYMTRVR